MTAQQSRELPFLYATVGTRLQSALALPPNQPDGNSAIREHGRRASTTFGYRTEPDHDILINDSRRSTSPSFWWCNEFETHQVRTA
jgi:hypothetical protein